MICCLREFQSGVFKMLQLLRDFWNDESGNNFMEYALVAAMVATVIMVSLMSMGSTLAAWFTTVSGDMSSASGG